MTHWDGRERRNGGHFDHGAIMERLRGLEDKLDEFIKAATERGERNVRNMETLQEKITHLEISAAGQKTGQQVLIWGAGIMAVIIGAVVWLMDRLTLMQRIGG